MLTGFDKNFKKWPIKVRLSLFIVLLSTFFLFTMYHFIHSSLHSSLSQVQRDFVYDRLHMLHAIIEENANYLQVIQADVEWEVENVMFPHYYLRFIDESGRVVFETRGMDKILPQQWFPAPPKKFDSYRKDTVRLANNGRYFLLQSDSMIPVRDKRKLTIQIALDVNTAVKIDEKNNFKIILIAISQILLLPVIIFLVIRKVIKPLDELVQVAEHISCNRLTERADPKEWPVEIERLAVTFNAMLDRLEDSLARLSHFASNLAHEIRTPINILMGEAEVALMHDMEPEDYKKVLESSVDECARLSRLVNNLLFLARAENPASHIERTVFDPVEEIEDLYTLYAPMAEEKGAKFSCQGHALLNGDPMLFRRAISNLLLNALNYSPPGVEVNIVVREVGEQSLEIVVSDTGFGIPQEKLPWIFNRLYRGDGSHLLNASGAGLGLSLVKAVMDLHGGTVSVVSELEVGTTFTLHFPNQPAGKVAAAG